MPLWKPAAIADRKNIIAYIAQDNPRAAIEVGDMLISKAAQLDQFPTLGRVGRVKGTRELVTHPNYVMVYEVSDDLIAILRVLHTSQEWGKLK